MWILVIILWIWKHHLSQLELFIPFEVIFDIVSDQALKWKMHADLSRKYYLMMHSPTVAASFNYHTSVAEIHCVPLTSCWRLCRTFHITCAYFPCEITAALLLQGLKCYQVEIVCFLGAGLKPWGMLLSLDRQEACSLRGTSEVRNNCCHPDTFSTKLVSLCCSKMRDLV